MGREQMHVALLNGLRKIATENRPYVPERVRGELKRRGLIGTTELPDPAAWATAEGRRVLAEHDAPVSGGEST